MTEIAADADGIIDTLPDGGRIRFERHLSYPIDEVWDAITSPARLAEWWLPFDAEISIDLVEGGSFELLSSASGDQPFAMQLRVLRVDPPRLFEHTHVDEGSVVTWELEPRPDGCTLRLTHKLTDVATAIEKCYIVGLHTSLDRLVPLLAGDPVPWDWERFAEHQRRYARKGLAPAPE